MRKPYTNSKNLKACILQKIAKLLSEMLNSNKADIFLRLQICGVTLRRFPSTGFLRASYSHRTSCNFDFLARYARKSRKLRAHSLARVKLRTGYWISFLKTFVTAARSANPVGFEVDSALHKRITYQWTDSVKNLYSRCILYFRWLSKHSKNSPLWMDFVYQISVWKIKFPAAK